ncbi:hypothetical protein [Streptomyces sp. CB03911]|uniref:hypothetical protein n=1 Tax=Streptomycetaceae TaxID=2062 RepID=UPI00093B5AEA|nr:hypothetical protein [Streptomyces sp. CB03911]OKI13285.1 hypothetical protein A6A07_15385 [Streptomyces sp. CB03911]
MKHVLVQGAVVECNHHGKLRIDLADPRVTVNGKGVLLGGMEAGLAFGSPTTPVPGMLVPCTAKTATTPPTFVPCVTGPATPDGLALKLSVGGRPVLMETASGTTVNAEGVGRWTVADAGQTLLEAL